MQKKKNEKRFKKSKKRTKKKKKDFKMAFKVAKNEFTLKLLAKIARNALQIDRNCNKFGRTSYISAR